MAEQGGLGAQRSRDPGRVADAAPDARAAVQGGAPATSARTLYITEHPEDDAPLFARLREIGLIVDHAACGEPAVAALEADLYDLVFLCACRTGTDGLFVLARGRSVQPTAQFVVLTDDHSPETAVEAMRLGAFDYMVHPVDPELLDICVQRALERTTAQRLLANLQRGAREHGFCDMVGRSPAMHRVYDLIERVAGTNATVLITGETGTGKELVARAVHRLSDRSRRPFVPISCAALPTALLESELFGHRRGSFTGAVANRRGLFEDAERGTVFLDDVETLGPELQGKLLRVLQERTIQPVGGRHDIPIDVRVIAATNAPLETLVESSTFRLDLYYRLNVFPIHVPPLRERRADIPLLLAHYRDIYADEVGIAPPAFAADVVEDLTQYDWPGNVRELEHWVERAVILSNGTSQVHLAPPGGDSSGSLPSLAEYARLGWSLDRLAGEYIETVLAHTEGHRGQAADILGIDRRTLYRKARLSRVRSANGARRAPADS